MKIQLNYKNGRMIMENQNSLDENSYNIDLGISEDYNFNPSTVVLFFYNGMPMFGKFIDYAKQRGNETGERIICQMFKKNSNEIKSRNWRLPVDSITIVEDYGQLKGVPCVEKLENGGFKFNKQ